MKQTPDLLLRVAKKLPVKQPLPTLKGLKARINTKDEYRAHVKAPNGKIIIAVSEGYKSRQGLENNLKKLGINPDALPKRIPRLSKPSK